MDVLQHLQTVLGFIQTPISLIKEHRRLSFELRSGLRSIKQELEMIKADMESYDELQVQELAYDIEDFMHSIWIPGASGPILTAIGQDPREEHLERIRDFKESMERLEKRQQQVPQSAGQSRGSPSAQYHPEDLVGIEGPKRELLEVLSLCPSEGQQPRVISILGCPGVGKTTLARAVHDEPDVRREFGCVAWVAASGCNDWGDLLNKVLENVRKEAGGTTSANLQDILADKRYLVFIDDVQQAELLKDTVHAFPRNCWSSRIIVTTSVRSVAAACSSGSYVYTMQCLDSVNSDILFWRMIYGGERRGSPALVNGSKLIFSKCDGLPLALTNVAKHLRKQGNNLRKSDCEKVGKTLGSDYLADNSTASEFGEIRKTLAECYDTLPGYGHKTCMLSLSIFPRGHQINSNSLVRRLAAEGLDADVHKCVEELIDRSIINPVPTCNSSKDVAVCQVHGIMLEYITQKAVSKNFVTLIREDEPVLTIGCNMARVRRVAVQSSPKEKFDEVADKSAIRSLTMFHTEVYDFLSCKMLRVLDLKGCSGLNRRILDGICELLLLKYLSLRKTEVDVLPTKIENLHHLETLDIRETRVEKLPVEVIMLPKLAYLFGMFLLPDVPRQTGKLEEFLTNKSVLHTISGFVLNEAQVFNEVILKARKLKKVKVCCKGAPTPSLSRTSPPRKRIRPWGLADHNPPTLQAPLQGNNNMKLVSSLQERFTALESVSIHSTTGLCKDFLAALRGPCTISSIKLHGDLESLPDPVTLSGLCNLTKLQLFSTGLSSEELSVLQKLTCLEYLSIAEVRAEFGEGNFTVENDGFESLHRMCFEAPKLPKLQFQQGALPSLTSLHLLCPDSSQMQVTEEIEAYLGVEGISHLANLTEVVLHYSATDAKVKAWKSVGNGHSNRPCVKRQPRPINNTAA
ncbi:hypothetical protein ACP70R_049599 [Stipagrostis hirtigluma subsp. patula]